MSHVLTSTRNPRVVELAKLHDPRRRKAAGLTLVEGPHQVADALAFGAAVDEVFALEGDRASFAVAESARVAATPVSQSVLRKLAGTDHPRGPIAVVRIPESDELAAVDTVVLWNVSDPGNAGAIVRSATAFGFAVATTPGSVDVFSPKVVRAAAATQFGNRVVGLRDNSLAPLRAAGLRTVATVARGGESPDALERDAPVALLIGNETQGLPPAIVGAADDAVTIPLAGGVESLNAAVAAAVVMYAVSAGRDPHARAAPG